MLLGDSAGSLFTLSGELMVRVLELIMATTSIMSVRKDPLFDCFGSIINIPFNIVFSVLIFFPTFQQSGLLKGGLFPSYQTTTMEL